MRVKQVNVFAKSKVRWKFVLKCRIGNVTQKKKYLSGIYFQNNL